tara:strand:+ start:40 stop:1308 length:1269 start_codon:yes stop_codon:yes gene_type:complete
MNQDGDKLYKEFKTSFVGQNRRELAIKAARYIVEYEKLEKKYNDEFYSKDCPVCYCKLNVNNIVNLKCKHSLCINCFDNWVDKGEKNSCPCCRSAVLNSSRQKELIQINIIDLEEEQADVREELIEQKKRCRNICDLQDKLAEKAKSSINRLRITQKKLVREIEFSELEFENICQSIDIATDKKKEWDKNPKLGVEYWTRKHNKFKRANEKRLQSFKRNLSCELNGMKKEHNKYYMYRKSNGELVDFNLKPSHIKNQKLRQKLYNNFNAVKNSLDVDLNGCMDMFEEDTNGYKTPPSFESRIKWTVDENDENLYLDNLFDVHPLDEYDYDTHWNERTGEWGEYDYDGYESSDSDYSSMPELEESDAQAGLEFITEFRNDAELVTSRQYYITPRSLTREFNRAARNDFARFGSGITRHFFLQE